MSKRSKPVRKTQIQTYVTEAENEQLQWAADELGITKAAFIRMMSLKAAKEVIE